MPQLLHEIQWEDPILPAVNDPEWEAEIKRRGVPVSEADRRIAPSRWLRETGLRLVTYQPQEIPQRLFTMGAMVTAQENACRYCYGANRAYMKILGYSESVISAIERDLRVAELDEKEHGAIAFCRNLARSRPRPAKADREKLVALGYSPNAVNEIAFLIAMGCFYNRLGILMACPPEHGFEKLANGYLGRLLAVAAPVMTALVSRRRRAMQVPTLDSAAVENGAFGPIVASVGGLPAAGMLKSALDGAFASTTLSRPAKALMFAVVARTLSCRHTEKEAAKLLAADGVDESEMDVTLQTLQSTRLAPKEAVLLAWARDTVYYHTPSIQKQTRALRYTIGDVPLLEAIGVAALANGTVRLAMLLE